MGHTHGSGSHHIRVDAATRRLLTWAVVPFILLTLIGLVILWPGGDKVTIPGAPGGAVDRYAGTVTAVADEETCQELPGQENFRCLTVTVRLEEGPDEGRQIDLAMMEGPNTRRIKTDERVIVGRSEEVPGATYYFVDHERGTSLLALTVLFAIVVIALSRWRGLAALAGLAGSLAILILFVLPALLQGENPLAVAVVGGACVMFIALYLSHGINAMTTTAILGTLVSLGLTGILAVIFVEAARFSGFGSEEAVFLQVSAQQINLQGLLLGSIIIGTLGVLDDVTVTQASAVWELRIANPAYRARDLYRAALRIGRDHIASTVNTLVLAYAGASLPLLILFTLSDRALGDVVTTEMMAEEIVRTLVGSIGLVASVPITTALAAIVAGRASTVSPGDEHEHGPAPEPAFKRPRAEEAFRQDDR
jgi:uncharacterized membrane protein